MEIIKLEPIVGDFAENKERAKELREQKLLPALEKNRAITFDFAGVMGATQSFVHALVSEAIRKYPERVFDNVFYRNANPEVQEIISIVYRYMQEAV